MPNIIDCPSCKGKLRVPEDLLSQPVQCPTCGMTFTASAGGNGASPESARQEEATEPRSRSGPPAAEDDWARGNRPARRLADEDDYDDRLSRRRLRNRRYLPPHRGTLILVLGILAVVPHGLHLIFGPIAWIMGNNDLKEMRAGRMDPEGESNTNIGRICGMIGTILGLIGLVVFLLFFCLWLTIVIGVVGGATSR
jgi:hypothetical protein